MKYLDQMDASRSLVGNLVMPAVMTVKLILQDRQLLQEYVGVAFMEIEVDATVLGPAPTAADAVHFFLPNVGFKSVERQFAVT